MSSPHVFRALRGEVYPFNFLLTVSPAPFGHPEGVDAERFRLVAPWEANPARWMDLLWTDVHSGQEFRITTADDLGASSAVLVPTYRDVLARYERHPEAKGVGVDGSHVGLLRRKRVESLEPPQLIGKEGSTVEELAMGGFASALRLIIRYGVTHVNVWRDLVLPVLQDAPLRWIEEQTSLSRRTIQRARNGHTTPREAHVRVLISAATRFADWRLAGKGPNLRTSTYIAVLAAYKRAFNRTP